ncbi:MAG: hypothetical protein ACUVXH_02150 [Anaerolineae bacterium]
MSRTGWVEVHEAGSSPAGLSGQQGGEARRAALQGYYYYYFAFLPPCPGSAQRAGP